MGNLFQSIPEGNGGLTAAFLTLLEHCGSDLANALLRKAAIPHQFSPDSPPRVAYPAPDGPPGIGVMSGSDFAVRVAAQAPAEPWDPAALAGEEGATLAVTLTGKAPPGVHALSWDQVGRLLEAAADQYDPESRIGFLVRQFLEFLPRAGIESFGGFSPDELESAPRARQTLLTFYQTTDLFFSKVAPAVAAVREGLAVTRSARPEDLLAGYCYRDFGGPALGADGFLRVALHLDQRELQVQVWLGGNSRRLEEALRDPEMLSRLQRMEDDPLLWLWSPAGEQKLPLAEATPESLAAAEWEGRQAAVQRSLDFEHLADDGAVARVADMADGLLTELASPLTAMVH